MGENKGESKVRFKVSTVSIIDGSGSNQETTAAQLTTNDGDPDVPTGPAGEKMPMFTMQEIGGHLALYEDEYQRRPIASKAISAISGYNPMQPGTSRAEKKQREEAGAKMGTFMGVYLPCIQNIFGVLFFIRLVWIVGTAGIIEGFFVVFICCTVTFLTSISLSAIATNGMVPGGGPYYMISRNLGPELGGAVGILFYLGTSVAGSMYVVGAVEIFVMYLVPQAKIFDDTFMCFRLFGTFFLIALGLIVIAGVQVVNKFALPAVISVIICILLTFIGVFVNTPGTERLQFCMVGDRVVNMMKWAEKNPGGSLNCSVSSLEQVFCRNDTGGGSNCDPYFEKARTETGRIGPKDAIRGMASGVISDNAFSRYLDMYDIVSRNNTEEPAVADPEGLSGWYVFSDLKTSFMILVGVFFPSCTGIMAGSNRSGDLQDASKSIPRGTIAATTSTSIVYLLGVIFFGASVDGMFMRDKFGEGAFGKLVIAELAVPHPMIILVGCFLSTVGAGMQSLTGAPRLLQAIAKDGVIPILAPFKETTSRGEPLRAILLTLLICEVGVLIALLEHITALITQFFLMCYLSVNTACALQSLLRSPGWRPRFKYYHWSLSMFGAGLCVAVMFISHWWFALIAIAIGAAVYKYIEYQGAEKEWGDGLRGLGLSAARYALINLEDRKTHTKNWRPQILVLCNTQPGSTGIRHERLMAFVSQLKAGKGLTVLATIVEGDYTHQAERAEEIKENLKAARDRSKIKGFCEVLVCQDEVEGISSMIQTSGLGGLRHNTVCMCWPQKWKDETEACHKFVSTIRTASAASCAILVPKNIDTFPSSETKVTGNLDVWWIVHDGGMLMLLPFLLRQHRTWRHTHLRIFTVAQIEDNSIKMKQDLKTFLYHLRINAEVDVIEMLDSDISEYTYERTLHMEQRYQVLKDLKGRDKTRDVQFVVDSHHNTEDKENVTRKLSKIMEDDSGYDRPKLELETVPEDEVAPISPITPNSLTSPTTEITLASENSTPKHTSSTANGGKGPPNSNSMGLSINTSGTDLLDPPEMSAPSSPHSPQTGGNAKGLPYMGLKPYNVRRMHTAVKLNEVIREKSSDSQMVILNLPGPPKSGSDQYYMEFVDALTDKLDRCLLVKGTGFEVVTIYS